MKTDELQLFAASSGDNSADTGAAAVTDAEENSQSEVKSDAETEFEELIKGKYADAFSKRIQGIIDKRFAKYKGYEKTAKLCEPILEKISRDFPGIDSSDTEKLAQAFLSAEKNEQDADEGEEVKADNTPSPVIEAARAMLAHKVGRQVSEYFDAEQEKLREIYPSFSLEKELGQSQDFRRLLDSGVSLRRAFETVNLEKIMGQALRYAAISAGKKTADAMKNTGRVSENPLRDTASSVQRTDVNNLTEKEIMKIISEVSKGAKITF